jgi:3-oxoacyl-[acyl-carrier-protein] synthase II
MLDRVSQFALVAARQAVDSSGIDFSREDPGRCGVFVGTAVGGAETTEEGYRTFYGERADRVKPFSVLAAMNNAAAAWIGIDYRLTGPNLTYSTACSSSAVAIGEAAKRIRYGEADVMIAGGAEAPLTFGVLRAWEALRTLAVEDPGDPSESCRPFAKTRTGLVLGEGAAFVILESLDRARARGAPIFAELAGYGISTDCGHITRPSVEGQAAAMSAALKSAALGPVDIGYVNAHGTGTVQNDSVETAALKLALDAGKRKLPVSSTKSMHGHLLGAAGALEFVIAVLSMRRGIIPPTMHLNVADPACDLDYVSGLARPCVSLRAVMSNSFAFGGTNAVLVARQPD